MAKVRLTNMVDDVGTTVYGCDTVGQVFSKDGRYCELFVRQKVASRFECRRCDGEFLGRHAVWQSYVCQLEPHVGGMVT